MSKTRENPMVEWRHINWQKLEKRVFKLQKRIYRAEQRGDTKAVRRLQKTLMRSWSAKCLAVRRVTQDNQGKKTAGVDGIKSLSPVQRLELVQNLKLSHKAKPTRRVWIPKPGTEEKRPLGIPTMADRALQALVKLALEPEWEAKFEPNSFGFRPGRSCHDAIGAIYIAINQKAKYVLDADIAKCFDRISHEALLEKLNTFPTISRQIRAWIKAGLIDWKAYGNRQKAYSPTKEGTPQGGVISPLLANIALHGMENRIAQAFPGRTGRNYFCQPNLIRYADDFVILHEDLAVVQKCQQIIAEWLKGMGLELKPSKTRLAHTLNRYELEEPGFNFLGFNIKQYPVGKYQSGTNGCKKPLGFKTFIKPSKEKLKIHTEKVGSIIKAHRKAPQEALIDHLNPVIKGWANYYSTVVSKETYKKADMLTYQQLSAWANSHHPNKTPGWVAKKYWQTLGNDNWSFASRKKGKVMRLKKHSETPIVRHVKVQGNRSPYDGDLIYWSARMGKHPEVSTRVATLLKRQKGKCAHCGLFFKDGDLIETDHKTPNSQGGRDSYDNWQLLHRHCHDVKTVNDDKRLAVCVTSAKTLRSRDRCLVRRNSNSRGNSLGVGVFYS
jgi:RNA-directed DNA polymerase